MPPFIATDGLLRPHVIGDRLEGGTQLWRCGVVDGFLFGARCINGDSITARAIGCDLGQGPHDASASTGLSTLDRAEGE